MNTLLDDLQSETTDELDKVSLDRLATLNPELLVRIKLTAEGCLRNGGTLEEDSPNKTISSAEEKLSFLIDWRTPECIEHSMGWDKIKIDCMKESHDLIAALRHVVMEGSKSDDTYTQKEAIDMTNTLGAAGAMATILTNVLERIRDEDKKSRKASAATGNQGSSSVPGIRGFFTIDKRLFTNEGLKKKNMAIIGLLYEIGLPFVSLSDGRRFATQMELSNHLDLLFKKK